MDIYIATTNQQKILEIKDVIDLCASDAEIRLHTPDRVGGMPEVEENGITFEENARLKVLAFASKVPQNAWVLGEDSGLCVDALGGAPGLYTSRYAGKNATHAQNVAKLLEALKNVPAEERSAYFYCCMILFHPQKGEAIFSSLCKGMILDEPRGQHYGYNPIFMPLGYEESFGELGSLMHQMSHRAKATKQLIAWCKKNANTEV